MDGFHFDLDRALSAVDRMTTVEPTGTERECECGVTFRAKRSTAKYCSAACRQAAYAGRPGADPERVCRNCGEWIGHKRANARYCDGDCKADHNNRLRTAAVEMLSDTYPPDELDDALTESGLSVTALFRMTYLNQFEPELLAAVDAGEIALADAFDQSMRAVRAD